MSSPIFLSIVKQNKNIQQKTQNYNIPRQARACSTIIDIILIFLLLFIFFTLYGTCNMSLHEILYLYLYQSVFYMFFTTTTKNITRRTTIWKDRIIVHAIKSNPFFVCILTNKKMVFNQETATN